MDRSGTIAPEDLAQVLCALRNKCIPGVGLQDQHEGPQTLPGLHNMIKAWDATISYTIEQANGVSYTHIHINTNTCIHMCVHT